MTAASYGDLFDDALVFTRQGTHAVARQRFATTQDAEFAVAAYFGLMDACRQHVRALITPGRLHGVTNSRHPHPVEGAALVMARHLTTTRKYVVPHPSIHEASRHSWDTAAVHLRAAADVMASHITVNGGARSPDALIVWDDVARHASLGRLGALVSELSSAQDALALRVGQAGMPWARVARWLPPSTTLQRAALDVVATADQTGATMTDLDALTITTPPRWAARPADQLGERVARIRQAAWNLRTEPDYSMRTLLDVAQAGFMVTAQTAAFHGTDLHDKAAVLADPNARRAGAWLALVHDLRRYCGTGPGDGCIHDDVTAVHDLLDTLVPRGRVTGDRAASADPNERHLAGILHGAAAGLGQVAEWNAATFARLARSGQVFVPLTDLTRDYLSEHPEQAAARLRPRGPRLVAAPVADTEATLDRYRDVISTMTRSTTASTSAPAWSAPRSPAAPVFSREGPKPR